MPHYGACVCPTQTQHECADVAIFTIHKLVGMANIVTADHHFVEYVDLHLQNKHKNKVQRYGVLASPLHKAQRHTPIQST
jgi:hypothetical protein